MQTYWCRVLLVFLTTVLVNCGSTSVKVNSAFPDVVFEAKPLSAAIVFTDSFRSYIAQPNKDTQIDIGESQTRVLTKTFGGLFETIEIVPSAEQASAGVDIIITPSVYEVQVATPNNNYLNVFEVWIKYNLELTDSQGQVITNWFMPAYGKTPDSFLASKEKAIERAANVALRDAGAKLVLDFFRIPAVNGYIKQKNITGA
jgi:hypothetical protein